MGSNRLNIVFPVILIPILGSMVHGQQVSTKPSTDPAGVTRSCTIENGMSVCRDVLPGEAKPAEQLITQAPTESKVTAQPQGKLLFLLDIPQDIFSRLAQDPAKNREFHAKKSWDYRSAPPAPAGADQYKPTRINGEAPWKYKPKSSFAYTPTRDWNYNRDVFGRIWRANIQHDTKVVAVPTNQPGTYLIPVGPVR